MSVIFSKTYSYSKAFYPDLLGASSSASPPSTTKLQANLVVTLPLISLTSKCGLDFISGAGTLSALGLISASLMSASTEWFTLTVISILKNKSKEKYTLTRH